MAIDRTFFYNVLITPFAAVKVRGASVREDEEPLLDALGELARVCEEQGLTIECIDVSVSDANRRLEIFESSMNRRFSRTPKLDIVT